MTASHDTPELSVVVPSYGCRNCLEDLCTRVHQVLQPLVSSFELVIVDDRSPDNSWAVTEALAKRYSYVRGVRLSRNFGQHIAITAGLASARGNYVVVMDCDLQDPPSASRNCCMRFAKATISFWHVGSSAPIPRFAVCRRNCTSDSWGR